MTTATQLPAALAPWAAALSFLTPTLAIGLGPLVVRLDDVMGAHDFGSADDGHLDGYDGIAARGPIERLLTSEWLLADLLPMEFLRRASTGELLYLAPHRQGRASRGRVCALVDSGPAQLGAARLVQLAALIVLHRRAIAGGSELAVGVLGQESVGWLTGDLADVFTAWLGSRTALPPRPGDVASWDGGFEINDEQWILTSPELARMLPDRRRVLASTVAAWTADGAASVRVRFGGVNNDLRLPDHSVSIRALRGASFRRNATITIEAAKHSGLRFPLFASAERRLLARGGAAHQVVGMSIPPAAGGRGIRPRNYSFPGPVLAASFLGKRLVVVVAQGDALVVKVVGKPLGRVDEICVPFADVSLDAARVESLAALPMSALYFHAGGLLWECDGSWWLLGGPTGGSVERPVHRVMLAAIGVGRGLDQPRTAMQHADRLWIPGMPASKVIPRDAKVVFGPGDLVALSMNETDWTITSPMSSVDVTIAATARVVGVVMTKPLPSLLTVSASGRIKRLVGPAVSKTLTRLSGTDAAVALHPTLPLVAFQRASGTVEVSDLVSGEIIAVIRAGA